MATRSWMRFVRWSLGNDPDGSPPIYQMECTTCLESSEAAEEKNEPELWCLKHAGRTGHTGFRGVITSFFRATPLEGPVPY